jgi:hypothetical protein
MGTVLDKFAVKNQKSYFIFSTSFPLNRSFNEIRWENESESDRKQTNI